MEKVRVNASFFVKVGEIIMSTNIKVIKFTSILSVIFLVITYLISVNKEISFFTLKSVWISNDFCLTIVSGMFGGTVIACLLEVNSYLRNKRSAEDYLYNQARCLYSSLKIMQNNILYLLENPEYAIPQGCLKQLIEKSEAEIMAIRFNDYQTICKKNKRYVRYKEIQKKIQNISLFLNEINYLEQAIVYDKLDILKNNREQRNVTALSPNTEKALKILNYEIVDSINIIGKYACDMNRLCGKRYNWFEEKKTIDKTTEKMEDALYEQFLEKASKIE